MPRKTSTPAASTAADPLAFQVLVEVGILDQLAQHRAASLLAPALNMPQFAVLNHMTRLGGEHSLVQLAAAMQVTKGAMTNTITRLQAKGLVQVLPHPNDGRGKQVSLTPAGQAARARAVQQLGQGLQEVAGLVAEPDLARTLGHLRQLREWFDQHR
jgi:DNA-binding MarR family transcriptional regulator